MNIAKKSWDIPPLRFLRFLTEDPGALSFSHFCRDSDPLPPHGFRIIPEASIFFSSLLGVTTFTERLPILFIPEELSISTVWFDVVHLSCWVESFISFTMNTQGMLLKKLLAGLSPLIGVHLCSPVVLNPNQLFLMLLTISIMGQRLTPRIITDALWFPGHQSHLPFFISKKRYRKSSSSLTRAWHPWNAAFPKSRIDLAWAYATAYRVLDIFYTFTRYTISSWGSALLCPLLPTCIHTFKLLQCFPMYFENRSIVIV